MSPHVARVSGHCPMGCGETLILDGGGHIACSNYDCEDNYAVDTILGDQEYDHLVTFHPETFTIRHPLRERVGEQLVHCALHLFVQALDGPPGGKLGTVRAVPLGDDDWGWVDVA